VEVAVSIVIIPTVLAVTDGDLPTTLLTHGGIVATLMLSLWGGIVSERRLGYDQATRLPAQSPTPNWRAEDESASIYEIWCPAGAMPPKIVHITSAHRTDDDRIFHKECRSLAEHGLSVTVIGPGEERKALAGVDILGVPSPGRGRLRRMSVTLSRLLVRCLILPADVYHFHDPDLVALGFTLKMFGRRVACMYFIPNIPWFAQVSKLPIAALPTSIGGSCAKG